MATYTWQDLGWFKDKYEAADAVFGDDDRFEVIKKELVDSSRWSLYYEVVLKVEDRGSVRYFSVTYSCGATEQQDERPFEYDEPEFTEVKPVEKVVIDYEPI